MKKRMGWVSNSSSCSFLVIGTKGNEEEFKVNSPLLIPESFGGQTEFGRECTDYTDFGDRLNFAVLLAGYWDYANLRVRQRQKDCQEFDYYKFWTDHDPDKYVDLVRMIRRVLEDEFKADIFIMLDAELFDLDSQNIDLSKDIWKNSRKFRANDVLTSGYIDHGSNWGESPYNLTIFDSEADLRNFLFNSESYVANQGDEYTPVERVKKDGQWCTLERCTGKDPNRFWNNAQYLKDNPDEEDD